MSSNHVTLWDRCLDIIKDNLSESAYVMWFTPVRALSFDNNVLTLGVPSYFFYEYLEEHYIDLLQRVLYRVFGNGVQLKYQVGVVENPKTDVVVAGANKSVNAVPQVSAPATHVPDPFKQQV